MKNYYHILGLPFGASLADIKSAYRKLAFQYHPDKTQGNKTAQEKFIEITEAYDILSSKDKSYLYHVEYTEFLNSRQTPAFQDYRKDPKQYPRRPKAEASRAEIDKKALITVSIILVVLFFATAIIRRNEPEPFNLDKPGNTQQKENYIYHSLTKEEYYQLVSEDFIRTQDSTLMKIENVDSVMHILDSLINLHKTNNY